MKVEDVMTRKVQACRNDEPLSKAAAIMWQQDCGCVPVIDAKQQVVGMLTDRDICMATWMQGRPVHELKAEQPMSKQVWTCRSGDSLDSAEKTMREKRVRRLPVVDADRKLVGILSLNDIVRKADQPKRGKDAGGVTDTDVRNLLADVGKPRLT